jgi:uncharacterized protein (TIGR02246 family)
MRRFASFLFVMVIAGMLSPVAATQQRGRSSDAASAVDAQIVAASNAWAEALQNRDVETVDRVLADDFVMIQAAPTGVALVGKTMQLEGMRKNLVAGGRVDRQLDRIRIKNYGNIAILTAVATYRGSNDTGAKLAMQAVISEVWVRDGGPWRLSHFQTTTVPPRQAGRAQDAKP